MGRSERGRASADPGPRRRILAVVAALALFGGLVGVTQVSNAETQRAAPTCKPTPPASAGASDRDGANEDDPTPGGTTPSGTTPSGSAEECEEQGGPEESASTPPPSPPGGGLDTLGDNCDNSRLQAHTGFQDGNRCVSTAFGEVAAAAQNPTLLIAQAPGGYGRDSRSGSS